VDFATALASAAQALNVVKALREIDSALSVADLKARMAELYASLADVRMALTDARDEIRAKEEEIAALKKRQLEFKPMIEQHRFKYEMIEGKASGLPYCSNCLLDGVQIRPVKQLSGHQCPKCKSTFICYGTVPDALGRLGAVNNDTFHQKLEALGAAEVRARLATKVYLGAEAALATAWLERRNEASSAEQLELPLLDLLFGPPAVSGYIWPRLKRDELAAAGQRYRVVERAFPARGFFH
jgi:hypothetical protein